MTKCCNDDTGGFTCYCVVNNSVNC